MHAIALLKLRARRVLWPEYQPRARQPIATAGPQALADMPAPIVIGERFHAVMHAAITAGGDLDMHEAILSVDVAMALQSLALKHAAGTAMTHEETVIATAVHDVIQHYVEA